MDKLELLLCQRVRIILNNRVYTVLEAGVGAYGDDEYEVDDGYYG